MSSVRIATCTSGEPLSEPWIRLAAMIFCLFSLVSGITYTITDPPLKLLRRFIPPLRLGGISLDLSFLVLFIIVNILITLVSRL